MYKISIIIPVYNVEKYIERGMKSLINQKNFEDLELVFINDGSVDKSSEIINKYQKKYNNIKLINKENNGVSSARNTGLTNVSGEFVCFFDADDEVENDYYQKLYNSIIKSKCEMVSGDYKYCFFDGMIRKKRKEIKRKIDNNKDIIKTFLQGGLIGNNLVDKIFITKIAKKIKFIPNKKVGEDMYYVYLYLKEIKSIIIDTSIDGYIYYQNDNSAMNSKFDSKFFDALQLSEKMKIDVHENDELYPYYYAHEMHERCKLMEYMLIHKGKEEYINEWKSNKKKLKKVKYKIIKRCLNKRQYLGILLMNFSPRLYMFFLKKMRIG